MDLNNLLSQIGIGSRETVYLSVTPGVGLELIQIDPGTKTVNKYSYRPLQYNDSLREIANLEGFKTAVTELFAELKINPKCNVVLNMPMVLFGIKELPVLLGDEAVTEALTSEVEQSYVFKRYEPIVSWIDVSNSNSGEMRRLFYTAIQKNIVDDIKNILQEIGSTLISVEVSLTSVLKALSYSNLTETQMQDGISWNLMLISQNGYSICSMVGKNIVDYYEEPLAIKSFEGDEIYNAINASAQITLMSFPANYLYIVSETDMVSAELLASRLQAEGIVNYLENNDFKKQDIIPVSLEILEETARKISLEAIGIAAPVNMPVKFNFLNAPGKDGNGENPDEPVHVVLGSQEFDISPNMARNFALIIAAVIIVPALLLFMFVPMVVKNKQAQLDDINSKLSNVQAEIKKLEEEQNKFKDFDVNSEIKKVLNDNRSKLMSYTALGDSIPKKLWLTYFVAKDDGKIDIKGESSNVEDVYTFYRNLKDSLINTKLRLHKLEMKSDSIDDAVSIDLNQSSDYQFEITNMTDSELNPAPPAAEKAPANPEPKPEKEEASKMLNKPLLNIGK